MSGLTFSNFVYDPSKLPSSSGIYGIFSQEEDGECLYIGKAKSIRKRVTSSHQMWREAQDEYETPVVYYTEVELTSLSSQEHGFIYHYKPTWNDGGLASQKWKNLTPDHADWIDINKYRKRNAEIWLEGIWRYLTKTKIRDVLRHFPHPLFESIKSIDDLENYLFEEMKPPYRREEKRETYLDTYPSLESSFGRKLPLVHNISPSITIPLPYLDGLLRMCNGTSILCPNAKESYLGKCDYHPDEFPDDELILDRVKRDVEKVNIKYISREYSEIYKDFLNHWLNNDCDAYTDVGIFWSYAHHLWLWAEIWDSDIICLSQKQRILFFNQFILKNPPVDANEVFCGDWFTTPSEFRLAFHGWCQSKGFQSQYQKVKDKPDLLRIQPERTHPRLRPPRHLRHRPRHRLGEVEASGRSVGPTRSSG